MAELVYTPRADAVLLIELGRATELRLPVYRAGALATPSSGTATVYDAGNTSRSSGAVTVTNGIAVYSVTSASTAGLPPNSGWRVEWALLMPDGVVHTYRTTAALCRVILPPAASDVDLWRRAPSLDPSRPSSRAVTDQVSYQSMLDDAWAVINDRLVQRGERPWLVVGSTPYRELHVLLTLALIFEDLAIRNPGAYLDIGRGYRQQFVDAWRTTTFEYDRGDSGKGAAAPRRPAGSSGTWLHGRGL